MTGGGADIAGCILAGGQSRRMGGGDKCMLPLSGRPLIAHVADRLAPQVARLAVNANGDPARFAALDLPVVADPIPGFAGPLAGVLAGLEWALENRPQPARLVTAAGDTPFFPADLAARLRDAVDSSADAIALAASGGRIHPVFGLWPTALAGDLRDWLTAGKSRKVLDWTARHRVVEVPFDLTGSDPFFNINTPDDMASAECMIEEFHP